ncbi:MAG: glycosyltransferase family 4 protein [Thermoguttaceae bacterium]
MKIGMVVEKFDPLRGGLEQWTYRLVQKLAQRGHEIHVVSREFSPRAAALPLVAHQVRRVHSPLAFAAAAEEKLASLPLDVIHDMGVGWYCDIFHPHGGSWASVTARKVTLLPPWLRPLKNMLHRVMPRYHIFRKLMARQYADHGQIMVALSRCVADDFVRFHQVAPQRIRIVYNGVDAERFSPARCAPHRAAMRRRLGIGPDTLLLLLVATNLPLKGIATLLRSLARLRAGGLPVHLLVVGGKRPAPWRRLAARLGVAAAVRFTEAVEDLVPYYAAADLYAHPTIYDTCSLVVLEAAACGLPVVTTRCNGAAELFHDGRDIVLAADPADDEHFAAAIQGLLVSPAARRALGEAARRTALAQSFDRNVDNVEALYEEVVERRARPAGDPLVWSARVRMSGAVPRARPADAAHAPPPASRTAPPRQFHPDVGAPR